VLEDEDAIETREFLGSYRDYPSRTWRAKSCASLLEWMKKGELYHPIWRILTEQGLEAELAIFHATLHAVQAHLRGLPLDQAELADIQKDREQAAVSLARWLDERRAQLKDLGNDSRLFLGLGDAIPPDLDMPTHLLAHIRIDGTG
jgi:hypothetical protein